MTARQLTIFDILPAEPQQAKEQQPITPMQKQWQEVKNKYPDAIILFRTGDFYEAYQEDAQEACKILGITLTHRGNKNFLMCGFPFHALDTYLPKLVRAGKRVAICDQIEEPKRKQLVKRPVTEYQNFNNNN